MIFPRLLIFLLFAAFIFGCREDNVPTANIEPEPQPAQGLIKITSPSYSENWYPGTVHTIRWEFEQDISKVDILLYRKDIKIMTIASGIDNKAFYDWTVPASLSFSHHYRIKVVDAVGKKIEDYSDYFYIIANL